MPFGLKYATYLRFPTIHRLSFSRTLIAHSSTWTTFLLSVQRRRHIRMDLRQIFQLLNDHALMRLLKNCLLGESPRNIKSQLPDPHQWLARKLRKGKWFPQPTLLRALQEFLGIKDFYRPFASNIAETVCRLDHALKTFKARKDCCGDRKFALIDRTRLVNLRQDCWTSLLFNTSDEKLDAALEQFNYYCHGRELLVFFSRQLLDLEEKYVAFDGNLFGMHLAIQHLKYFLEGRQVQIHTDHRPWSMHSKATDFDRLSAFCFPKWWNQFSNILSSDLFPGFLTRFSKFCINRRAFLIYQARYHWPDHAVLCNSLGWSWDSLEVIHTYKWS